MTGPTETVDAVVIGGGHNGLVAANLLADEGWHVLVLEAADQPGGAVRTDEISPGYLADLCSAFYPLGGASPVLAGLELEQHGLRWVHSPLVLAHVLPDDRAAVISRDLDETAASVDAFAPGDGDAWLAEAERFRRLADQLLNALFQPFPPVRAAAGLLSTLGVADALRFARFAVQPVKQYITETFTGEGAKVLLAGNALHTDLQPESAASSVFGWLLAMLGQFQGFPVPEGGAGALTGALVSRLSAAGGQLRCAEPVEQVLVARGRAVGVRTASGALIQARKAVLADVAAPHLYRELVGDRHLPSRLRDDLDRFAWDNAIIKVDWALSGPVPWTAEAARKAGTVHLGVDLDGLTQYGADLARRRIPKHPFVLAGQMAVADPTRTPPGGESLWAYTHVPHGHDWKPGETERHADRVQALFERHAPGFADRIVARRVLSTRDVTHGNPSLPEGSANLGTAAIHQQLFFRPVPGLGRPDTPIDRLYLASASAHPGGGVHGGPGSNAARAALLRNSLGGPAYAALIRSANRAVYS
ncbi:phytoene desaturase family protein [Cryptosporangium aurantiacum]|uniref:Pyridine nucleotide-disulfide oxidoreductase domain-containing protein 2 n=1 Tax=Cryptosporangium aurantiacum TaxID=134849 RepID=A0A1M7RPJ7_9ACTN|nr:NAD(P)/FAD-dependent oxidoreductase [Cryptosporangium aurantiacum]SHN48022.1 Phytoene dehydrogenase-related protein [Cryptosporangium aurantiacum]